MPKRKSLYSPHPSIAMVQKWIADLPAKTGRSLDAWLRVIAKEGPTDEKDRRVWLKEKYDFGTNSAWWLAERSVGKGTEDDDPERYLQSAEKYVADMFSGAKAALRPLYDELLKRGLAVAKDVKACPCQTIVPLYRNHVFAQIKPTTRTRIDMGFALKDAPATGPLIDTGGFAKKDRITHRIPISKLSDIDAEVVACLRRAYALDA
jgi:Domain of unknown function (DUF5655)/Domain of unknown function (DUF4287)